MRKVIELQMKLGEFGIKDIEFDLKSRDEITKLLIGIQSIYCDKETIAKAFEVLVGLIPGNVDKNNLNFAPKTEYFFESLIYCPFRA